jgi:integrase
VAAFRGLKRQPFEKLGERIPRCAQRVTNDDLSEALSHQHLELLRGGMPEPLQASIRTGAYGLKRRSELMGLERSMITWPTLPEQLGQASVVMSHTYVVSTGNKPERRPWGKTPGSTRETIHLPRIATEELRQHMLTWRSNPNPDKCEACRSGLGEHPDAKTNPHRNCDFANDAPVWWDPFKNQRLHPNDYSNVYFAAACKLAGLTPQAIGFKPTPKLLRATGATLLIDAGVPIAQVAKMGRWANEDVLRKHYHRMRDSAKTDAAQALDNATRGELGLEGIDGAGLEEQVRFQQRRIEVLEQKVTRRDQLLSEFGVDIQNIDTVTRPELGDLWPKRDHALSDIDTIRHLAATKPNRGAILKELGLSDSNQSRLDRVAAEHGITLPPLYGRNVGITPPGETVETLTADALQTASTGAATITQVMKRLGLPTQPRYRIKLEKRAAALGVVLPAVKPKQPPLDLSALDDIDRLRTLAATLPTLTAIMQVLGIPRKSSTYNKLHELAKLHDITLPDIRAGESKGTTAA